MFVCAINHSLFRSQEPHSLSKISNTGTGYLYEFGEGSVFGEFAALDILPKRIYDAVAMCETELWTIRRPDLLDAFTGADEYVLAHITRIATRHLKWITSQNELVNKAIEMYGRVAEISHADSVRSLDPDTFDTKKDNDDALPQPKQRLKQMVQKSMSGSASAAAFLRLIASRKTEEKKVEQDARSVQKQELEELSAKIVQRITSKLMDRINQVEKGLSDRLKAIEHEVLHFDEAVL